MKSVEEAPNEMQQEATKIISNVQNGIQSLDDTQLQKTRSIYSLSTARNHAEKKLRLGTGTEIDVPKAYSAGDAELFSSTAYGSIMAQLMKIQISSHHFGAQDLISWYARKSAYQKDNNQVEIIEETSFECFNNMSKYANLANEALFSASYENCYLWY